MTHKHAEVLRAIADGVPLSEFEAMSTVNHGDWMPLGKWTYWAAYPDEYKIRRKPQYIMVNGFKVPKPLDEFDVNQVFWPYLSHPSFWDSAGQDNKEAKMAIKRKMAHSSAEAAIAHAKAMLGIDPEA